MQIRRFELILLTLFILVSKSIEKNFFLAPSNNVLGPGHSEVNPWDVPTISDDELENFNEITAERWTGPIAHLPLISKLKDAVRATEFGLGHLQLAFLHTAEKVLNMSNWRQMSGIAPKNIALFKEQEKNIKLQRLQTRKGVSLTFTVTGDAFIFGDVGTKEPKIYYVVESVDDNEGAIFEQMFKWNQVDMVFEFYNYLFNLTKPITTKHGHPEF